MPKNFYDVLPNASPKTKAFVQFFVQVLGLGIQLTTISILDNPKGSFFGIYQASKGEEIRDMPLSIEGPLKYVRHPIMTGFFCILWSAPAASRGRILYNLALSTYIVAAVFQLEEPHLIQAIGESYRKYMEQVPNAFFPFW
jgi:protein-S-isoprenylcysteine O-methyltransferase Ste14